MAKQLDFSGAGKALRNLSRTTTTDGCDRSCRASVVENDFDTKLDESLKRVCSNFVEHDTKHVVGDLVGAGAKVASGKGGGAAFC